MALYDFGTPERFATARRHALDAYNDALAAAAGDDEALPFDPTAGASMADKLGQCTGAHYAVYLTPAEAFVMAACFEIAANGDSDVPDDEYRAILGAFGDEVAP